MILDRFYTKIYDFLMILEANSSKLTRDAIWGLLQNIDSRAGFCIDHCAYGAYQCDMGLEWSFLGPKISLCHEKIFLKNLENVFDTFGLDFV